MGTPVVRVRPATLADEAAVGRLKNDRESLAWQGVQAPTSAEEHAAWYRTVLQRPDWCVLVAVDDKGLVVGYAAFLTVAMAVGAGITVEPSYRREGVGSILLAAQEAEAKKRGCTVYGGVVNPANHTSWRMFWRRGFVLAQRMPTLLKALV